MMKKIAHHSIFFALVAIGILIFQTQTVNADIITSYLDEANSTSLLPDGNNYVKVIVSVNAQTHTATFEVAVNTDLLTSDGKNFGIDGFYFNYDTTTLSLSANDISVADGFKVDVGNRNVSEFGVFEVDISKGGAGIATLTFTIQNDGIVSADQFYVPNTDNYIYTAHVKVFEFNGQSYSSAFFGDPPPVPEPSTLLLLGGGLVGMNVFRKLRRRS